MTGASFPGGAYPGEYSPPPTDPNAPDDPTSPDGLHVSTEAAIETHPTSDVGTGVSISVERLAPVNDAVNVNEDIVPVVQPITVDEGRPYLSTGNIQGVNVGDGVTLPAPEPPTNDEPPQVAPPSMDREDRTLTPDPVEMPIRVPEPTITQVEPLTGNVNARGNVSVRRVRRGQGPLSYIIRNAQLRQAARHHVQEAISLLQGIEGTGLEKLYVDDIALPVLSRVLAVIDLETNAKKDIAAALRDIESARGIVRKMLDAISEARMPVLYSSLGSLSVLLAEVAVDNNQMRNAPATIPRRAWPRVTVCG